MATIGNDPNGRKRILFVASDGSRKTIRLGLATRKQAEAFKLKVESLVTSAITGSMPDETARWLSAIPDAMYAKLVSVGLASPRESAADTVRLGPFLDSYLALRADVKAATQITYANLRRNLTAHFGEDRPVNSITEGDGEGFRIFLAASEELADNTVRRRIGIARQLFTYAVKTRLIERNPFEGIPSTVRGNPDKFHMVTPADTDRLIEACPDAEWRLIVALCRYGGVRCPSEVLSLKWAAVDWARERITVTSPNTTTRVRGLAGGIGGSV